MNFVVIFAGLLQVLRGPLVVVVAVVVVVMVV